MGDVIKFTGATLHDLPPQWVLDGAAEAKLKTCIVIGEHEDGSYYFASSTSSGPDNLWLTEKFRQFLLDLIE